MNESVFSPFPFIILHDCMIWGFGQLYLNLQGSLHGSSPRVYVFMFRHKHRKQRLRDNFCLTDKVNGIVVYTSRNAVSFLLWPIVCVFPGMQVKLFVSQWNNEQNSYNIERKFIGGSTAESHLSDLLFPSQT